MMKLSSSRAARSRRHGGLLPMGILLSLLLLAPVSSQTYPQECANYAPPAVIKGNKIFVSTTGEYLPIKGINYYPRPNDGDLVLGNSQDFYSEEFRSSWERDIAHFQNLGINAIRLYAVNPGLNHDGFMCALKAAGIYVIVGLAADCENCAVQWQDPPNCYPLRLQQRGQFIIQQFARYENVLGFSAGNEVSLSAYSDKGNLPCQKKFIRDMRAFIQQCAASSGMRHIPVGVIFADHDREIKAQYYNCRSDPQDDLEEAEFLGINSYLHCDGSATDIDELIGYKTLLAGFQSWGLTVPALWTEFGCLNDSFETIGDHQAQRNFLQVDALFSPEYREVFNGGFVFEYSTEKVYSESQAPFPFTGFGHGNYGVGYFSPENCNGIDIPCEYIPKPQFQSLASRYNAVDAAVANEVTLSSFNPPVLDPPACPTEVPALSQFVWPTDDPNIQPRQCPVLVPVYCFGVPGDCVTVPHPSTEILDTGAIDEIFDTDPVNVERVTNTTAPVKTLSPTTSAVVTQSPTTNALTTTTTAPSFAESPGTASPSLRATSSTTSTPTVAPIVTAAPTGVTSDPTAPPTVVATPEPTTGEPTRQPSARPSTASPTFTPTDGPSASPSATIEAPAEDGETGSDLDTVEGISSSGQDVSNTTNGSNTTGDDLTEAPTFEPTEDLELPAVEGEATSSSPLLARRGLWVTVGALVGLKMLL
ncbi:3-beta-glucanosyltransferase [Seminavis robusta]|uniref:3-beta-glucanosyltransferase n=1 Tax=Seminavis robusta TaxID=568900 RepID=A0A9N8HPU7_9STRA|nr:3-beta-glucanosyltransferase [Seminavis robusta]|eukprot:Sro1211_g252820.1 3-beta-glucanosyltransferase (703) ;mRNA; r:18566-20843